MRIVLCDDNKWDLKYYTALLNEIGKEEHFGLIIDCYESGEQALFNLGPNDTPADLILMDIHMAEVDGMSAAQYLRKTPYEYNGELIFTTGSKEYVFMAFDVQAYHYIVKGETSRDKAKDIIRKALKKIAQKKEEYILFKGIGEYRNIEIASIQYFEVIKRIVQVHYGEDQMFEFYSSIGTLEAALLAKGFIRVHRSYLVSVRWINRFGTTLAVLKSGAEIPVGRKYLPDLRRVMGVS